MDIAVRIAELSEAQNYPDVPGPELLPTRLMRACAQILPVQAAGISVFTGFRHRVPLGASDDTAALAESLQFTVGEGPCLAAHAEDRVLLATETVMAHRWPSFCSELLSNTPYRAIVSLPVDGHGMGGEAAMDLHYTDPRPKLSTRDVGRRGERHGRSRYAAADRLRAAGISAA